MTEPSYAAGLIESFLNTIDLESGEDDIATPGALADWLTTQGLTSSTPSLSAADHRSFLALREGFREALDPADPIAPRRLAAADAVLATVPVLVALGPGAPDGGPAPGGDADPGSGRGAGTGSDPGTETGPPPGPLRPAPGQPPAATALARLAVAWTRTALTGEIERLKRCAEHTCGWVFWDTSKNRSRRWCSMRVCGNRTKSRRYTSRHRATTGAPTGRGGTPVP
ncbi:CGNR zinc finger domain-containing protein [Streptomyces sp. NPDC057638]|uniref:CGNR zinc finger domain-containing protein n=1 Tax=Streptomyces sp. NPDC057638 TaxID=3346190 RepID=UPI0036AB323B